MSDEATRALERAPIGRRVRRFPPQGARRDSLPAGSMRTRGAEMTAAPAGKRRKRRSDQRRAAAPTAAAPPGGALWRPAAPLTGTPRAARSQAVPRRWTLGGPAEGSGSMFFSPPDRLGLLDFNNRPPANPTHTAAARPQVVPRVPESPGCPASRPRRT